MQIRIGEKIRTLRKQKNISQETLAAAWAWEKHLAGK